MAVQRQTARKITISHLREADYVKEEGWNPNYLQLRNGERVSRANVIALVISPPEVQEKGYSFFVDDGTGQILVRGFEKQPTVSTLQVGNAVLLIGRPREFNNDRYLLGEVVKPIDKKWLEVRKHEIAPQEKAEVIEEQITPTGETTLTEAVYRLIKELDHGKGADIEEVVAKAKTPQAEEIISTLIREGEIFEFLPGKLKVLD